MPTPATERWRQMPRHILADVYKTCVEHELPAKAKPVHTVRKIAADTRRSPPALYWGVDLCRQMWGVSRVARKRVLTLPAVRGRAG